MEASLGYVEPLKKVLERSERTSVAGNEASDRLSTAARDIRQWIRTSAVKAVHMVEASKEQLLQRVDDIEAEHLKLLDMHGDETRDYRQNVSSALQFALSLSESTNVEKDLPLAAAFEGRARSLLSDEAVVRSPLEGTDVILSFVAAADEELPAKAVSCVGELQAQRPAKAEDCVVLGPSKKPVKNMAVYRGGMCTLYVAAASSDGKPVTLGGSLVSARWLEVPEGYSAGSLPSMTIDTCSDGTARVSTSLTTLGTYAVQVAVNGQPLKDSVRITCDQCLRFSREKRNSDIEVSDDGRRAVLTSGATSVVLGRDGFDRGKHNWCCTIGSSADTYVLGAVWNFDCVNDRSSWGRYSGWASDANKWDQGKRQSGTSPLQRWKADETFEFFLDCDAGTLEVVSCTSGLRDRVSVPKEKIFPAFFLFYQGNCVTLIDDA